MRVALSFDLGTTLTRGIYSALLGRIAARGWELVREHGMVTPFAAVRRGEVDVVVGMVREERERRLLRARGVPVINCAYWIRTEEFFQIVHDNRAIGRMAAEHLGRLGHRCAVVVGYRELCYSKERVEGFADAMSAAGGECTVRWVSRQDAEGVTLSAEDAAVYAANDDLAAKQILALERAGRRVPRDVAVIGTDNEEMISRWLGRWVTSVVPDHDGMADAAERLLAVIARNKTAKPRLVTVPPLEVFPGETATRPAPRDKRLASAQARLSAGDLRGVDIAELASAAGMSRRNFERCYREETGVAPGAAILEARMGLARRLLADERLSIEDVAERCGYADRHHFTMRFSRSAGVAPGAYRARGRLTR